MYIPADEFLTLTTFNDGVYYFAAKVESDGTSWCPDCVEAKPILDSKIRPACVENGVAFSQIDVGARDSWKNPEHPLRRHPLFKVERIPSLILIKGGKKVAQLKEEQIWDLKQADLFISELN